MRSRSQWQILHWMQRWKSSGICVRRTNCHRQDGRRWMQTNQGSLCGDWTNRGYVGCSLWLLPPVYSRVFPRWCIYLLTKKEVKIHLGSVSKGYEKTYTLAYLFPVSFGPASLGKPLPWWSKPILIPIYECVTKV